MGWNRIWRNDNRYEERVMVCFLTGLLGMSLLLGGCTSKSEKKALEYKELGIKQMQEAKYDDAVSSFQKALDQSLGRIRAQELDVCYYKALAQYKSGDTRRPSRPMMVWWIMMRKTGKYIISEEVCCWQTDSWMPA